MFGKFFEKSSGYICISGISILVYFSMNEIVTNSTGFSASTNCMGIIKQVSIEVLKRKNVLLFISGLDISDDDISILKPIYEFIRKEDQYKIVWIPIVEQWTEDLQKKFEMLRAKMTWHVVQYFLPIAGIRFIKEKWHFKGKPSVVVLSPQGKVESDSAIHMIRVWGIKAFPFTTAMEEKLSSSRDWIGSIATGVNPNIESWVNSFYESTSPICINTCTYKLKCMYYQYSQTCIN